MTDEQRNIFIKNYDLLNETNQKIEGMVQEILYPETWTKNDVEEFEKLVDTAMSCIIAVDSVVENLDWKGPEQKDKFDRFYGKLKRDARVYFLTRLRHNTYLQYRTNRKILISKLNTALKLTESKPEERIFDWFNEHCAKVNLYNEADIAHLDRAYMVKTKRYPTDALDEWFHDHVNEVWEMYGSIDRRKMEFSISDIFAKYKTCRKGVFAIYNTILSTNTIPGTPWADMLKKYETDINRFVRNQMPDKILANWYLQTRAETEYIEFDDYYQILDDYSWHASPLHLHESAAQPNVNESWFDDFYDDYNTSYRERPERPKQKADICKINMVTNDANACKIKTDPVNRHVYANATFYPGNIVEVCPTKDIAPSSLYSQDMRDIAFEVTPGKEWVRPIGYCNLYDLAGFDRQPNVDFRWDPVNRSIVITAMDKIEKGNLLILNDLKR